MRKVNKYIAITAAAVLAASTPVLATGTQGLDNISKTLTDNGYTITDPKTDSEAAVNDISKAVGDLAEKYGDTRTEYEELKEKIYEAAGSDKTRDEIKSLPLKDVINTIDDSLTSISNVNDEIEKALSGTDSASEAEKLKMLYQEIETMRKELESYKELIEQVKKAAGAASDSELPDAVKTIVDEENKAEAKAKSASNTSSSGTSSSSSFLSSSSDTTEKLINLLIKRLNDVEDKYDDLASDKSSSSSSSNSSSSNSTKNNKYQIMEKTEKISTGRLKASSLDSAKSRELEEIPEPETTEAVTDSGNESFYDGTKDSESSDSDSYQSVFQEPETPEETTDGDPGEEIPVKAVVELPESAEDSGNAILETESSFVEEETTQAYSDESGSTEETQPVPQEEEEKGNPFLGILGFLGVMLAVTAGLFIAVKKGLLKSIPLKMPENLMSKLPFGKKQEPAGDVDTDELDREFEDEENSEDGSDSDDEENEK